MKVAGADRDSTGGTAAEPATAAGKTLRKAVAGSTAANEDYDWKDAGHEFIGVRVARAIQRLIRTLGHISKWLPPDDEDEALFHMVHEDGDEEDLNEAEVRDAELHDMVNVSINDPVSGEKGVGGQHV